jgi:hypothetical protein
MSQKDINQLIFKMIQFQLDCSFEITFHINSMGLAAEKGNQSKNKALFRNKNIVL